MTTPLLAVGIGNTSIKLGLLSQFDASGWPVWQLQQEWVTADFTPESLAPALPTTPVEWGVGSVQRSTEQRLQEWIRAHRPDDLYRRLSFSDLPLTIEVTAPDRVGLDRLAAAVAANHLREHTRPAIIIDAGTAITVNLVTADGVFQGGVILPGFALTARALAVGTDQLPLVTADLNSEPPHVVGKSTEEAIRSGLFWGNVGAVREIVARVEKQLPRPPQIFVTGGSARRLAECVSADALFVPDLVIAGIARAIRGTG